MKAAAFRQCGDTSQIKIEEIPEQQIKSMGEAIDRLVYKLYGLTEEEIKIVENQT